MESIKKALCKKLLKRAYVGWEDSETGAPCINPKRPYGNSDVAEDVREILDIPLTDAEALELHKMTESVLQDVLKNL